METGGGQGKAGDGSWLARGGQGVLGKAGWPGESWEMTGAAAGGRGGPRMAGGGRERLGAGRIMIHAQMDFLLALRDYSKPVLHNLG